MNEFGPYWKSADRPVIQVERKERGDWIVWNWNTQRWDESPRKIVAVGEKLDEAKP